VFANGRYAAPTRDPKSARWQSSARCLTCGDQQRKEREHYKCDMVTSACRIALFSGPKDILAHVAQVTLQLILLSIPGVK
jgi:hypothetical protein